MSYLRQNAAAWNRYAESESEFAKVATDEECRNPLGTLDARGWLPTDVRGMNVLCLAAAGGWQSILYATAGARVVVVDLSPAMLHLDHREAEKRELSLTTHLGTMDDLSMLSDGWFDIVHQPVSTCYVPDIGKVYREIARVTKPGGIYISQHKQPTSLQITHRDERNHFVIGLEYYRQGPLPRTDDDSYRETGTAEYLHRWDQLVGELCRSGFVLEDLREPCRADYSAPVNAFGYRGRFTPPYVRMKARRSASEATSTAPESRIWIP